MFIESSLDSELLDCDLDVGDLSPSSNLRDSECAFSRLYYETLALIDVVHD